MFSSNRGIGRLRLHEQVGRVDYRRDREEYSLGGDDADDAELTRSLQRGGDPWPRDGLSNSCSPDLAALFAFQRPSSALADG